jgi:hypothetical protein
VESDLTFELVTATPETIAACRVIDHVVLEFTRDPIHEFLLSDRPGYLYLISSPSIFL